MSRTLKRIKNSFNMTKAIKELKDEISILNAQLRVLTQSVIEINEAIRELQIEK